VREDASHYWARTLDAILSGQNPGDLPVHRHWQTDLAINLQTAQDLTLRVPKDLLLRAATVISPTRSRAR
jgi:ABC-type uncharacterized transport system substrate-binding protein